MKCTVEDIKKILEEKETFKFMKIDNNGEKKRPIWGKYDIFSKLAYKWFWN